MPTNDFDFPTIETTASPAFAGYGDSIVAILTMFDVVSEQLQDIAQDIETSVLGVCSGFQGMSNRARSALSKASAALDAHGQEGGLTALVHRTRSSLATMLCRIESSRNFSLELADQINEVEERLSLVVRLGEKVTEIAADASLAIAQSLAGVRRQSNVRAQDVSILEKASLITQVTQQCAQAICAAVCGMKSMTKESKNRAHRMAEEDEKTIASSEVTIRSTLELMTGSYERLNESLAASSAMNHQLNMDIGQAVMSMQFQDRVNQRIAHIVETLVELSEDLRPYLDHTPASQAESIARLWTDRLIEKATMDAERKSSGQYRPPQLESTIDLF